MEIEKEIHTFEIDDATIDVSLDLEGGEYESDLRNVPLKEIGQYTRKEKIANGVAATEVALSIFAIIMNPFSTPVIAMSLLGLAIAPVLALSQQELTDHISLQRVATRICDEMDFLQKENKQLKKQIDEMRRITGQLEELEGSYAKVTELQIENVGEFARQLERMRKNSKNLQTNISDKIMTFIIDAAIKFDTDGDNQLSDDEAKHVIGQVANVFGVNLKKDRFMDVVRRNRSIGGIMTSFRNGQNSEDPGMKLFDMEIV